MFVLTPMLMACGKKDNAISEVEKTEKDRPGIAETKAIAEEALICAFPMVMSYGIIHMKVFWFG